MGKYKLAIFDLDGTILDTIEDIKDSLNYTLRKYGLPERSLEEVRNFVGNGMLNLVKRAAAPVTEVQQIHEDFVAYYKEHCAIKTRPYEGIINVIEKIKRSGIRTAVVSNKTDSAVKILCQDYFPGLFECCIGDREGKRRKPYPDNVNDVRNELGIDKTETVYIGDSEVDYETALNAGTDLIIVTWGFRKESDLRSLGVSDFAHTMEELAKMIME